MVYFSLNKFTHCHAEMRDVTQALNLPCEHEQQQEYVFINAHIVLEKPNK